MTFAKVSHGTFCGRQQTFSGQKIFPKLTLFTDAFYSAFCSSQKHFPQLFIPLTLKILCAEERLVAFPFADETKARSRKTPPQEAHSQEAAHYLDSIRNVFQSECLSIVPLPH